MIKECIASIKEHSKDYELIIIDDCSPMDTTFLKHEANIYYRREKNGGCAMGWNDGLRIARGEYLVVISDDVVVKPEWLEAMTEALEDEDAFVSAPAVEHLPNGMGFFGIQECRVWFPGSCFMMKKSTLQKVGYFDEQFHPFNYEDVDYWTRVYRAGGKLMRNYRVEVEHKEGQVIHSIENNGEIDKRNREKYLKKWGFDPTPIFYGHTYGNFPWES